MACGTKLSYAQVQALLRSAGFPDIEVSSSYGKVPLIALFSAIGQGESALCTNAINPGVGAGGKKTNEYSVGLFQVNTLVHKNYTVQQLTDPLINAKEAYRIYRLQGFRAWGAYSNGSYKKNMPTALAVYRNGGGNVSVPTAPTSTSTPVTATWGNQEMDYVPYALAGGALAVLIFILRR